LRIVRAITLTVLGLAVFVLVGALWLRSTVANEPSGKAPWWAWWSWADGVPGFGVGGVQVGSPDHALVGSDRLISQVRALGVFHAVRVRGPIDLMLRQGDRDAAAVHTDDNIASLIRTEIVDGELQIEPLPGAAFRTKHAIGVTLDARHIDRLDLEGMGDVLCAQLDADGLDIQANGAGQVRFDDLQAKRLGMTVEGARRVSLSGKVDSQQYTVNGAARIDANELVGQTGQITLNGTADVSVWINRRLDVTIEGAGRVQYRGMAQVTSTIHGIGVVEQR
jgi:hypothetical protein